MSEQQVFYTELNKKNLSQSQHNRTNNNRSKKSGEEEEKLKPHRSSQQKSKPERLNGKETREQQVTYSELNKERLDLPWKDQKSKGTKGRTSVSEQSVTYTELKLHNQPQRCSPSENAQSKVTQQQGVSTSPFPNPSPNTINDAGCDRAPCPGDWIGFRNSCYFFSNDRKNWGDSKSACAAQNSSLLWIDNQEEQVFLAFFSLYAWIGLSHNEPGNSWKWEDGTDFSNHQLTLIKIQTEGNCVFRSARYDYEGNCEDLKFFVCKWRTHS
ncbi:NKG2-C type II integral membrane protein-like isoform X1 [Ornithorhynchus anatinus]|uniref:NKG2-C type II integral membrane protein-like isoform X1 n=1 Tax=Ornithorhynchus anatinus TaxID=9258 RepID=UPI0010A82D9D|nr:NKG2-C type II integral membrane protein-like isoform X1 [Ornithorhynchus anatinus]